MPKRRPLGELEGAFKKRIDETRGSPFAEWLLPLLEESRAGLREFVATFGHGWPYALPILDEDRKLDPGSERFMDDAKRGQRSREAGSHGHKGPAARSRHAADRDRELRAAAARLLEEEPSLSRTKAARILKLRKETKKLSAGLSEGTLRQKISPAFPSRRRVAPPPEADRRLRGRGRGSRTPSC